MKQVTFRLSVSDIEKIKKMAEDEALPYQTLIWGIIHKIANKKNWNYLKIKTPKN